MTLYWRIRTMDRTEIRCKSHLKMWRRSIRAVHHSLGMIKRRSIKRAVNIRMRRSVQIRTRLSTSTKWKTCHPIRPWACGEQLIINRSKRIWRAHQTRAKARHLIHKSRKTVPPSSCHASPRWGPIGSMCKKSIKGGKTWNCKCRSSSKTRNFLRKKWIWKSKWRCSNQQKVKPRV